MKSYIVLGLGRFGRSCARALAELGHEVLGVDNNEHVVQQMSDVLTRAICAESNNEELLRSLGITNFDSAVVAIGGDIQSSIMTTLLLKELGIKYILAKAQDDLHAKVLYKVGADKVVFPERDMGIKAANNLVSSNIVDTIELSSDYSIIETAIPHKWIGKEIGELAIRAKYGLNILAIKNKHGINVSPQANVRFEENDTIAVMGKNSSLGDLQKIR